MTVARRSAPSALLVLGIVLTTSSAACSPGGVAGLARDLADGPDDTAAVAAPWEDGAGLEAMPEPTGMTPRERADFDASWGRIDAAYLERGAFVGDAGVAVIWVVEEDADAVPGVMPAVERLDDALFAQHVGTVESYEVGGGEFVLWLCGADVRRLWAAAEPGLENLPVPWDYVELYEGSTDADPEVVTREDSTV